MEKLKTLVKGFDNAAKADNAGNAGKIMGETLAEISTSNATQQQARKESWGEVGKTAAQTAEGLSTGAQIAQTFKSLGGW